LIEVGYGHIRVVDRKKLAALGSSAMAADDPS